MRTKTTPLRVLALAAAFALTGCSTLTRVDTARMLSTYDTDGEAAYRAARYDESLALWQTGLDQARQAGSPRYTAAFLTNIGVARSATGDYEKALERHAEALAIRRQHGDRRGEAASLTNLGDVHFSLGLYEASQDYFEDALLIERRARNSRGEAANLSNLGAVYARLGDNETARRYAEQALRINRALGDTTREIVSLSNLGVFQKNLGDAAAAAESFAKAMHLAESLGDRHALAVSLGNQGLLYQEQGDARAAALLERSEALLTEIGDVEALWRVRLGLARLNASGGDAAGAVTYYQRAIEGIERLRAGLPSASDSRAYLVGKLVAYDELIALYHHLHRQDPGAGYDAAAIEVFERRQGRAFLDQVARSGARRFSGVPDALLDRERDLELRTVALRERLVSARAGAVESSAIADQLKDLDRDATTLRREIQRDFPHYFAMKYPAPATAAEIRGALAPNEAILVYHVAEGDGTVWLIDADGTAMFGIDGDEGAIDDLAARLRENVGEIVSAIQLGEPEYRLRRVVARLRQPWDEAARALYAILFPPALRNALPEGARLYVVPTGPLYDVPFAALNTAPAGAAPRYLVEDHGIAYLSSATLLGVLRSRPQAIRGKRQPLLAFADPDYGGNAGAPGGALNQLLAFERAVDGRFAEIPDGAAAAREIARILDAPAASDPLQLRERADRSRVLSMNESGVLDDYRYLFFSVHGVLPGEINRVVQPALVLSRPGNGGFLTMADVFGLDLDADLVTLSACNTARGDAVRGEGVMGMTRAFMYAGADAVGATQWPVESRSIQRLAVRMHAGIAGGMSKAEALKAAMRQLLAGDGSGRGEMYRHPYFWAPLTLFGDGA